MPVWVVTGKLGAGKGLVSVSRVAKYLMEGRKVATNMDIFPEQILGKYKKNTELFRLPDIPTIESLKALPLGYEGDKIDESRNGLIVLDECGIFFDSRGWNNPNRKPINAYFKLLRKLRWDAVLIIQDIENLDSDARRTIAEHVVYCRRTDRMTIPVVSSLFRLITSNPLPLPKMHMGIVKYGTQENSPLVDRWNVVGTRLYSAYDTEQLYSEDAEYNNIVGLTTMLPSYYSHGRYTNYWEDFKDALRRYKIKSYHFFSLGVLAASFAVNALVTYLPEEPKKGLFSCNDAYKGLYGSCSAKPVAPYEYYYPKPERKPEDVAEEKEQGGTQDKRVIYIAGWFQTSKGIEMTFIDDTGEPYYPMKYKINKLGDCVAIVQLENTVQRLTCMPDEMAYTQPDKQLAKL